MLGLTLMAIIGTLWVTGRRFELGGTVIGNGHGVWNQKLAFASGPSAAEQCLVVLLRLVTVEDARGNADFEVARGKQVPFASGMRRVGYAKGHVQLTAPPVIRCEFFWQQNIMDNTAGRRYLRRPRRVRVMSPERETLTHDSRIGMTSIYRSKMDSDCRVLRDERICGDLNLRSGEKAHLAYDCIGAGLSRICALLCCVGTDLRSICSLDVREHREHENDEGQDFDSCQNCGKANETLLKRLFSSVVALFLSAVAVTAGGSITLCTSVWRCRGESTSLLAIGECLLGMIGCWFLFGCSFSVAICGCPRRWLWGIGACASYTTQK